MSDYTKHATVEDMRRAMDAKRRGKPAPLLAEALPDDPELPDLPTADDEVVAEFRKRD